MTRRSRLAMASCAALALAPVPLGHALAVDLAQISNGTTSMQRDNAAEMQILRNQIQRDQFQLQQQFNRQQERQQIAPVQPRPAVPSVQQDCRAQGYGANRTTVCR